MNETQEHRNPFRNGKLIGPLADPSPYYREEHKRGDPAFIMTRSNLKQIARNPWRWVNGYEDDETEATDWGSVADAKLLSPALFAAKFAVCPETYPDDKGERKDWHFGATYCKTWKKEHAHQTIVPWKVHIETNKALEVLFAQPDLREYVKVSQKQVLVTAEYEDPETKLVIPVKVLIDLLPPADHPKFGRTMGDYKSAADAHPVNFGRDVNKYWYDAQAGLYLDVYSAAVPEERDEFRHIISEKKHPFAFGKRIVGEQRLEKGRDKYHEALALYCQCLANKEWPGYDRPMPGVMVVDGWTVDNPEIWM